MTSSPLQSRNASATTRKRSATLWLIIALVAASWCAVPAAGPAAAQRQPAAQLQPALQGQPAAQDGAGDFRQPIGADEIQSVMNAEEVSEAPAAEPSGIDMLTLILSGGRFMIPIGLMSLLVVTLAAERMLALRRGKVLPKRLVRQLDDLADPIESFDPSKAYRACLENASPLASVVASMLMRTGQPLGEIERTATETIGREADRYASPVRWLSLSAAATPLMGLLGTVWGMIIAFHESTALSADRSRSEQLSEGIYTALVTTLAGLAVAIPAAIFAQYLENRIAKLFHEVEQFTFELAPGLSRFTARNRLTNDGDLVPMQWPDAAANATPPPPPPAGIGKPGKAARAS